MSHLILIIRTDSTRSTRAFGWLGSALDERFSSALPVTSTCWPTCVRSSLALPSRIYSGPVDAGADVEGCEASRDDEALDVAFASKNRSTPSAERDAAFGSRDPRPCSPACRHPLTVMLACWPVFRSSTEPLPVLSLRLQPAAS